MKFFKISLIIAVLGIMATGWQAVEAGEPETGCKLIWLSLGRYLCGEEPAVGMHIELKSSSPLGWLFNSNWKCHADVLGIERGGGILMADIKITQDIKNCPMTVGSQVLIPYQLNEKLSEESPPREN